METRMQEEGVVVEREGLMAKVAVRRGEACGSCRACISAGKEIMITHAQNRVQAKVGEKVRLEISSGDVLKAGFWVYILPLSGLILGLIIGDFLAHSEVISLLSGLAGFALTFLLVHAHDKKIRERGDLPSKIIEVIKEKGTGKLFRNSSATKAQRHKEKGLFNNS